MPWQSYGFYFCQGIFPRNSRNTQNFLLRSVDSVGDFSQAEGSVNSVGSVGDQRTLTICVDLRNLWEVLPKQKVL